MQDLPYTLSSTPAPCAYPSIYSEKDPFTLEFNNCNVWLFNTVVFSVLR